MKEVLFTVFLVIKVNENIVGEKFTESITSDEVNYPDGKLKKTNKGVCYKHFPSDCPKKKQPGGSLVPTVLPSIFGCTDSSLFAQTAIKTLRDPDKRNITVETRAQRVAVREEVIDTIDSFVNLVQYCAKLTNGRIVDSANPEFIKMFRRCFSA